MKYLEGRMVCDGVLEEKGGEGGLVGEILRRRGLLARRRGRGE